MDKEEIDKYGLHSLQIRSATNLSQGVDELELQRAGRWKTAASAQDYFMKDEGHRTRAGAVLLGQLLAM